MIHGVRLIFFDVVSLVYDKSSELVICVCLFVLFIVAMHALTASILVVNRTH